VDQTDAQLAQEAGQGNPHAFGILVERYRAGVVGYITGLLGAREDAEELAQETFLKAWQQARTLQNPATFSGWLYRIAHNLAMTQTRKRRPVPLLGDPPERVAADSDEDRSAAVLAAVARLSEDHREVIAKRHFDGFTHQETALQLGIPEGTVRSRISRAYRELREMLFHDEL
jgi:RNA polymerase sigma-70 factor (ECF subfamily)